MRNCCGYFPECPFVRFLVKITKQFGPMALTPIPPLSYAPYQISCKLLYLAGCQTGYPCIPSQVCHAINTSAKPKHLLYSITVQYNSKSYILRCSVHAHVWATKGVIYFVKVRSSCLKWNENITNSGWRVVQYREYCTQKSCICILHSEKLYWTRRSLVQYNCFFIQYSLYWTPHHPLFV